MNVWDAPLKRRNAVLGMATLTAALPLSACGAGGGNGGAATDGAGGGLTVLVEGGGLAQLQPAADLFTEQTGTEITFVELPYENLYDRIATDLSSGNTSADVMAIDAIWLPTFAAGLESLDDFFTEEVRADLFESVVNEAQYEGTFVGVPAWANVGVLLYRTDLIEDPEEQANFEAEYGYPLAPPETWEQYRDIAVFFTRDSDGDGATDLYGADVKGAVETNWLATVLQAGAEAMVVDADGNVVVNDAAHLEALNVYAALNTEYQVSPPGANQIEWVDAQNLFYQGQTAMTRFWAHGYTQVPEESPISGNVGVAPMPAGEAGIAGVPAAWYLSIPGSTGKTDLAREFIAFVFEHNELGLETDLGLAATRSALEEGAEMPGHENLDAVIETLDAPATASRPAIPEWQRIVDDVLIPMLQAAVAGESDNQQLLDDAKSQIEDILG